MTYARNSLGLVDVWWVVHYSTGIMTLVKKMSVCPKYSSLASIVSSLISRTATEDKLLIHGLQPVGD